MSVQSRPLRVILATLSGFLFTMFVICALYTRSNAQAQGWEAHGFDWLPFDAWSRAWEIKEAFAGAMLTMILACTAEFTAHMNHWLLRLLSWGERLAAHPIVVGILALMVFVLPDSVAKMTRPAAPEQAPNVLYVMVDTWRADHVGWLGYDRPVTPKLDRLVQEGVIFERAVSASGWTKPAVASQLTGQLPSAHQAVSQAMGGVAVNGSMLPPAMTTWLEVLRARGWETAMYSNNPNILPAHGFHHGVAHFVDYVDHPDRVGKFEAEEGVDPGRSEFMLPEAREWIDQQARGGKPFAAYLHIMDPHYPYVAPEPYKGTFSDAYPESYDSDGKPIQLTGAICGEILDNLRPRTDFTPQVIDRIKAIYDEEILYTDDHLEPFLRGIREDYPNTVIVLVSDHGEEFMEHGQLGHGHTLYAELVNVPLVIWAPRLEPVRVPFQVSTMDLYPTLLELTGLVSESENLRLFGESLVEVPTAHRLALAESGGDERPAFHWRSVSDGNWKVNIRLDNRKDETETLPRTIELEDETFRKLPWPVLDPLREESDLVQSYQVLYDISQDRAERVDLIESQSQESRRLKGLAQERLKQAGAQYRDGVLPFDWFSTDHIFKFDTKSGGLGASDALLEALGYKDHH